MSSALARLGSVATEDVMRGFSQVMAHVCGLYACGESSSVSEEEGHELAASVLYVLGASGGGVEAVAGLLASDDAVGAWTERRKALEARIPQVVELWQQVVATMPPIRNIALRDTLESIGRLPSQYDTFFAAHEVPCSIDYPLSVSIAESLQGLDYVEAWLLQLLAEARFLAQLNVEEMAIYLEKWCPDYKGLLINLYDPIREAWQRGEIELLG